MKGLPSTSEQQLAADLSRRPNFIEPFLLACASRNVKLAGSAVVCLQRLVILRGLPKSRLKDVLDAFNSCTSLSLDVQLKILQALPALAQNYAQDLNGEHLAAALLVCAVLQNVKAATISGVASATLQQLVVSVYEKVAAEDAATQNSSPVTEVPGDDGPIPLRGAAFDAYRVFLDICLATEGRRTQFVHFPSLPQTVGLELIWTCLDTHKSVFSSHPEQLSIVRTLVMPFIIRLLSERQSFPMTLRAMRIVSLVLQQHIQAMPEECGIILGLLNHMVEPESAAYWKRALCMEVFRMIYAAPGLALQLFMLYDLQEGKKSIIRDNVASFVRLSTERPAIIGLGQHSSVPTGPANSKDAGAEQVALEAAGGVTGVISTALTVAEANVPGISIQWSIPKAPCLDQLDKNDAPPLPETYMFSLVLDCLNSLSENLAKVILPLTVQRESRAGKASPREASDDDASDEIDDHNRSQHNKPRTRVKRSQSYRARTVPINPLTLEHVPAAPRVKAIAGLIEECWPALLATSSTFLYSALDNDLYRTLIRSFQRFAQVSGLLNLVTARDAFLTTLGKSAVPPNVLNTNVLASPSSPKVSSPGFYSNASGLLSVESIVSQSSGATSDRTRRPSQDPTKANLTTRNLLCLRALLNIAIAIGPALGESFAIVLETLHQADVVLSVTKGGHDSRHNAVGNSSNSIGTEIKAVEATASRLFESTADYPNEAFLGVLTVLCKLLDGKSSGPPSSPRPSDAVHPSRSPTMNRTFSLPVINTDTTTNVQDYSFALSKIGRLADLNVARFASYTAKESGWRLVVEQMVDVGINPRSSDEARLLAADILGRCSIAIAQMSAADSSDEIGHIQKMALSSIQLLTRRLYAQSDELTGTDIAVHCTMLDAVRAILESCGDSLVAGWDLILSSVESAFQDDEDEEDEGTSAGMAVISRHAGSQNSQLVAPELGRIAFSITQLICSDFLASLPEHAMQPLLEILYRFASQDVEVNVSLTTIALFFDVSNFLVHLDIVRDMDSFTSKLVNETSETLRVRITESSKQSRSAQWLLLLCRLSDIVSDERTEVRDGAFQTLMRIFSDHGDDFTTATWQTCAQALLLKMLEDNSVMQRKYRFDRSSDQRSIQDLNHTSKILLEGVATIISQHINTIEQAEAFPAIWSRFVKLVKEYLGLGSAIINTAALEAVTTILGSVREAVTHWAPAVVAITELWAEQIPTSLTEDARSDSEQAAFLAYTSAAAEIYRLTQGTITAGQIEKIAENLLRCVREAKQVAYGGDANSLTPLQSRVLDCLKSLRTDIDGVPSLLLRTAADIVALPFASANEHRAKDSPSFVALSKASMEWLSYLLTTHITKDELFTTGAIAKTLQSLTIPIALKYEWNQNGRAPPPWKKSTSSILQTLPHILGQIRAVEISADQANVIWTDITSIAHAIMHANFGVLEIENSWERITEDEQFDCAALSQLRDMIIPRLGNPSVSDTVREYYTSALFHASTIHTTQRGELPGADKSPLSDIARIRFGRVRDPAPTPREDMSYQCFAELVSMVAVSPDGSEERVRLAQAAAPWTVLRFATVIKTYIADQPLRGRLPMPLSMVEELLWVLSQMRGLRCESKAFAGVAFEIAGVRGLKGGGERVHIQLLHELLVRAVGVAGHRRHGNGEILAALMQVLEADE